MVFAIGRQGARTFVICSQPEVAALSFGRVDSVGGILPLAQAEKTMSDAEYTAICHGLDSLVKSPEAAMLLDQQYEELQKLCADARTAAEKGDFEEAHRIFAYARNLLDAENNIPGTE